MKYLYGAYVDCCSKTLKCQFRRVVWSVWIRKINLRRFVTMYKTRISHQIRHPKRSQNKEVPSIFFVDDKILVNSSDTDPNRPWNTLHDLGFGLSSVITVPIIQKVCSFPNVSSKYYVPVHLYLEWNFYTNSEGFDKRNMYH